MGCRLGPEPVLPPVSEDHLMNDINDMGFGLGLKKWRVSSIEIDGLMSFVVGI